MFTYPDLDWYTGISKAENLPPRCPYANVHRCPRYYHSLYLLGRAGITTKIEAGKITELDSFWAKTDILPAVAEHEPRLDSYGDKKSTFSNFCPEISFDIFGLFADYLHRYSDEIDTGVAHRRLEKEAYAKDWRWEWAAISPLHYLKCSLYSQLFSHPGPAKQNVSGVSAPPEIFEAKLGYMGISINLKALFKRLANRLSSRHAKKNEKTL